MRRRERGEEREAKREREREERDGEAVGAENGLTQSYHIRFDSTSIVPRPHQPTWTCSPISESELCGKSGIECCVSFSTLTALVRVVR